jgi:hypothetical protein
LFIFSTPVLIRHLWQLKTVVFQHWHLICAVPLQLVNFELDFNGFVLIGLQVEGSTPKPGQTIKK